MGFLQFQSISISVFLGIMLLITLSNLIVIKKMSRLKKAIPGPMVSILVPARNEEKNIFACVKSLLNQDYSNIEVIVLEDRSSDRTMEILQSIGANSDILRIIKGKPLPDGWLGKHWACNQLSAEAKGKILFFTDADTVHSPSTVSYAVKAMQIEELDLLTAVVRERTDTLGELLTVPFMVHSILSIFPLAVAYRTKWRALSVTCGQFMMFKKESYCSIGGHESVRDHGVDDLSLGKLIKKAGMKWRLYNASDLVECKMYESFKDACSGFLKNYFALFEYRLIPAIFVWTWILAINVFPLTMLMLFISGVVNSSTIGISSTVSVLFSLIFWLLASAKFALSPLVAAIYPLITTISSIIGYLSILFHFFGSTKWKGRVLVKKKSRLI
ncbi:MAG: glycosyltransferase [Kosmotogaceae bacterium]|nr:glycosyltransferase [Kosmotogaceae bacterium]